MSQAVGRPTNYTKELAQDFCSRIALGNSLRKVVQSKDMPSHQTIYNWFGKYPDFVEHYARAKQDSGDSDADRIEDIAEKVMAGDLDPQAGRVAMDAYKWTAGKKRPKKYGDLKQIEQTVKHTFGAMSDDELEDKIKELQNGES